MRKSKLLTVFILLSVLVLTACGDNPEKTAKSFGEAIVNREYSDVIDYVYFPESDFITEEKINELKTEYFDDANDSFSGATSYSYSIKDENDDYVTFVVAFDTPYGPKDQELKVRKEDNKIDMPDLYREETINVFRGSTVKVDGEELSVQPEQKIINENSADCYNVVLLNDIDYRIKVTHPVFKTKEFSILYENEYCDDAYSRFKDSYKSALTEDLTEACSNIFTVAVTNGDVESLNKYFVNKNAAEYLKDNDFKKSIAKSSDTYKYSFIGTDELYFYQVDYLDDTKLKVIAQMHYKTKVSAKNGIQIFDIHKGFISSYEDERYAWMKFECEKTKDGWKISSWNLDDEQE